MNVTDVAILILTALALLLLILAFSDLAREFIRDNRRRKNERIAEEASAIVAALCAYDLIREAEDKGGEGKKEVDDGEDKAL